MKYLKLFEDYINDTKLNCVATLIIKNKSILILKRGETAPWMPNKWNLPGGIVDAGENENQAAIRETFEETNLEIINLKIFDKLMDEKENYKVTYFITKNYSNEIDLAKNQEIQENSDYEWVNIKTINNYKFVPHTKEIIMKYLNI